MRETISPKISGTARPSTRAHTHTASRPPPPFFVCRVGIAYLSIFLSSFLSLSLSHAHTPRSSVESPRYRGYTVGDVAEPVREGGSSRWRHLTAILPRDVNREPSGYRPRTLQRSVLPHWLLSSANRLPSRIANLSIRDSRLGGISLWSFLVIHGETF